MDDNGNGHNGEGDARLWRGMDFSGVTVMIGVSTGQLLQLLLEQVQRAEGQLVVLGYRADELASLAASAIAHLTALRARPRQLPLADASVDLLVLNGALRETPVERLPAMAAEVWRVLTPGGQLRVSDIVEASEAESDRAWAERNRLIRRLGEALGRPTALAVDLRAVAAALTAQGFEQLRLSILPGYPLSEEWLSDTLNAVRNMASRVPDAALRREIIERDLPRLAAAYALGGQCAAQRVVLSGAKAGNLALNMSASFTEADLRPDE